MLIIIWCYIVKNACQGISIKIIFIFSDIILNFFMNNRTVLPFHAFKNYSNKTDLSLTDVVVTDKHMQLVIMGHKSTSFILSVHAK